jgi:hypothetical protein
LEVEDDGVEQEEMGLTESLVRTKLSTSISSVAPALALSSPFFGRAMTMILVVMVQALIF